MYMCMWIINTTQFSTTFSSFIPPILGIHRTNIDSQNSPCSHTPAAPRSTRDFIIRFRLFFSPRFIPRLTLLYTSYVYTYTIYIKHIYSCILVLDSLSRFCFCAQSSIIGMNEKKRKDRREEKYKNNKNEIMSVCVCV